MKKSILIASLIAASALQGCTDADKAQIGGFGAKFEITLYAANGSVIKQWRSNGKVQTESHSDGWYFMDAATGKLVRVSGTVVVDQLD
ncbi:hypothetical protein [Paraburkholderia antibiotica]|uniref:Lipoprotein n=1 Tax=Paraburkholderia antibiotica TaxID=2728839 RepID=A0A7Y0A1S2_9BURK|nr:hypothetical protein [Paraburkholderia antibiotica]NML34900.1 hypothetical protein [Paraburkholderia antibiotica]